MGVGGPPAAGREEGTVEVFVNIDVEKVHRVLLGDGWHHVKDASFAVGGYGFVKGQTVVVNAIAVKGVASHWARWTEPEGTVVTCPLTSVLALESGSGVR
jgi:hypothetical protein